MATDPRYLAESGREIFTGNELLIKGALEAEGGVNLLTGYPGSPVAGFFDIMGDLADLFKAKGIRAFQANNEALGAAALNGSQMTGARGIVAFKSVGTHVAADALALGNLAGAHPDGGAIVISGEDPWCDSTQVPADSRFLFEHLRMPVVEPGTSQQLKDWIDLSFKLSQAAGMYIGYIVTVAHADGGGTVDCHPNQWPEINTNHKIELETRRASRCRRRCCCRRGLGCASWKWRTGSRRRSRRRGKSASTRSSVARASRPCLATQDMGGTPMLRNRPSGSS
jgi:indolepyruvate ferredoxin oxidoreductase